MLKREGHVKRTLTILLLHIIKKKKKKHLLNGLYSVLLVGIIVTNIFFLSCEKEEFVPKDSQLKDVRTDKDLKAYCETQNDIMLNLDLLNQQEKEKLIKFGNNYKETKQIDTTEFKSLFNRIHKRIGFDFYNKILKNQKHLIQLYEKHPAMNTFDKSKRLELLAYAIKNNYYHDEKAIISKPALLLKKYGLIEKDSELTLAQLKSKIFGSNEYEDSDDNNNNDYQCLECKECKDACRRCEQQRYHDLNKCDWNNQLDLQACDEQQLIDLEECMGEAFAIMGLDNMAVGIDLVITAGTLTNPTQLLKILAGEIFALFHWKSCKSSADNTRMLCKYDAKRKLERCKDKVDDCKDECDCEDECK